MKRLPFIKLITIVLCQLSVVHSFGQGQANNWYFGTNAGLTFNTGTPQALTDGVLSTLEGCVTISDKSGRLLFYTDGITVWNKNHAVMPNGTGLLGNPSAAQSGVVVPKPGDPNRYYIFTVPAGPNPDENPDPEVAFRYSEVDMSLNGGMGDVVAGKKNILLFKGSSEKIAVASHENGLWYWAIGHQTATGAYYAYLVNCEGVQENNPVISKVGEPQTASNNAWIGYLVASPDGKKVAAAHSESGVFELFDFNNATGELSNRVDLNVPAGEKPYGIAFSPSNKVLYGSIWVGADQGIHQWDLTASDINASKYFIDSGLTGAVQLGPDGKLYVARPNETKLGVINNPDVPGAGCGYEKSQVDLAGKTCRYGLPPFVSSFFAPPKKIKTSPPYAPGAYLPFSIEGAVIYTSLLWDFGDGATSTDVNPTHSYAEDGIYPVTVTLYGSNCAQDETLATTVIIGSPHDLEISADATICIDSDTNISASGGNGFGYAWDNGLGTGDRHTVSPPTTTTYTVTTKVRTGTDLIVNGDFEQGNVGFTTQYNQASSGPGSLAVADKFQSCADHTSTNGQMLVLQAASGNSNNVPAGANFWCQTVDVEQNRDYGFSAWIVGAENPVIGLSVNGTAIAAHEIPSGDICWSSEMLAVWNSGNSTKAQVCLSETSGAMGKRFAVDDIAFYPLAEVSKSVTVNVITEPTVPKFSMETTFCLNSPAPVLPTISDEGISGTWLPTTINTAVPRVRTHTFTPDPGECAVPADLEIQVTSIDPGAISGNQTICADIMMPGWLRSRTDATSNLTDKQSAFIYLWQYSVDDGATWHVAPGKNDESSYLPGQLTQTTMFRRMASTTQDHGDCPPIPSNNTVKVTVKDATECGGGRSIIWKDVEDESKNGLAESGEILTYTIRLYNSQNYNKPIKKVSDPIPAGTSYVPGSADNGGTEMVENGVQMIVWENVNVPANSSTVLSFQVQVTDNLTGLDQINNEVTFTRNPDPSDTSTGDEADVDIQTNPRPALTAEKTVSDASADGKAQAGELLTYTIRLENTGDVDLSDISVGDVIPHSTTYQDGSASHGGTETDGVLDWVGITVPFGQTVDLTFNVKVTDDLTGLDQISNTAEVFVPNRKVDDMTVSADIPTDPVIRMSLTKEADWTNTTYKFGDEITYTIILTNTGTVSLFDIGVTDANVEQPNVGFVAKLAPGDSETYTAKHKVSQTDVDAGQVDNLALASGKDPDGTPVIAESTDPNPAPCPGCNAVPGCPTCTIVPVPQNTGMTVEKNVVNKQPIYALDETVTYKITVTNTGNVTLTDIRVTDDNADDPNVGHIASLDPGDSASYTATHTVAQPDVDAGTFVNIAVASGKDPKGNVLTEESTDPDCATCTIPGTTVDIDRGVGPKMALLKKVSSAGPHEREGDVIAYTITVTNTGSLTLTDIRVTDNNADAPENHWTVGPIAPGHSADITARHTLTQTEVDAGQVVNIAIAEAKDPEGNVLTEQSTDPDCSTCTGPGTTVTIDPKPDMALTKVATSTEPYLLHDKIVYSITVTNTGNVTLTDIKVKDDKADDPNVGTETTLAPYASVSFPAEHTVTQPDVDAGKVVNVAIAEAKDPNGTVVTKESTDPNCTTCTGPGTTVPIYQNPSIGMTKTVANRRSFYRTGQRIEYRITVTNEGNVTLTDIDVTDGNADDPQVGNIGTLAVGSSEEVFTAYHTVSPADWERGYVSNMALAKGKDPNGGEVTATSENPISGLEDRDPVLPECPSCTVVSIWKPIEAVADKYVMTRLQDRAVSGSVLDNDLLDGQPVNRANVILTPLDATHPNMRMEADGTIAVPPTVVPGRYEYRYRICEVANPRNCAEALAVIDVLPDLGRMLIPNVFTPNGDGVNDTFEIAGIDNFDRVSLEIINRWGNTLYRTEDYQNEWDGGSGSETWHGETCFYLITLHNGNTQRTLKGWVMILRDGITY